jgi:hypothetical protein
VIGVELDVVGLSFAVAGGDISLGTAAARALVDPVFSFNQEAFDEFARTKGFPTFGLTQFHAFEFSPGVTPPVPGPTSPVPEPSSVALIVAGVLVVAAYKRNRLLARSRAAASLRQRAESHARAVG